MARQVLPIAGALVGGAIGGPMGAQIGFAAGSIIGGIVDPQIIKGPKIGEASLQTSAEGVFRPIIMGTAAVKGNIIERGNRQIKQGRNSSAKGGPEQEAPQRVYWTFAIRLCEGPITGISRIWQDEKLVYDARPGSGISQESSEYAKRFRLYLGDELQMPDPDLEAYKGMGNVNAYRGTAYLVFPNFDLTDMGERIPDFRVEAFSSGNLSPYPNIVSRKNYLSGGFDDLSITSDATFLQMGGGRKPIDVTDAGAFVATSRSSAPYLRTYAFESGWVEKAITGDLPALTLGGVAFSVDGQWLAVGASAPPYLMLYRKVNGVLEHFSNPTIQPEAPVRFAEWSRDGTELAISVDSLQPVRIYTQDSVGNLVFSRQSVDFIGSATGVNLDWSQDGSKIAYGDNNRIRFCDTTTNPISVLLDTGLGAVGGNLGIFWSRTGQYLYLVNNVTDYLTVHRLVNTGGMYSLVQQPSPTQPTAQPDGAAISYNGSHLVVSQQDGLIRVYETDGAATLTLVDTITGETGQGRIGVDRAAAGAAANPGRVGLDALVSMLYGRVEMPSSDFDVSELTDQLDGIAFAGDYTVADAVRTLMPPYFFDAAEFDAGTGYKLQHIKRGKPVVATITADDLIDAPENSVREDALERPLKLHLAYESPTIGYAPAKATVSRDTPDVKVVGEVSIQIPVSFSDPEEARRIAHKLHKIAWVEVAGEQEFTLPDNWLSLVPTDCIGVSLRGQVRRMRIGQEMLDSGSQGYKLFADRQSAYTSNITGIPLPTPTPPPPSLVGQSLFVFGDWPALNDGNDRLGYYNAVTGQTEAWYGALVQRQELPDTTWDDANTFRQNSIIGTLLAPVAMASEFYTDTTNSVQVQLYLDDEIESLTDQQFLSEGGSFALENPDGSWEIMQYRDAVDEGNSTFTLSHLARGRVNSGASAHSMGARFVLLDTVQFVDALTSFIGSDLGHRAVSFGTSPELATQHVDTYTAKSQTEFPVAHLFAELDGDSLNLSAVPRHRFGTELMPVRSINWSGYRWTATDGSNTASHDGTASTHAFDVTGWTTPITVTVAQLNRFTGPGPTVSEEVS